MLIVRNLELLLALLVAGCVAADTGDDFSNNLFSDLAPYVLPSTPFNPYADGITLGY